MGKSPFPGLKTVELQLISTRPAAQTVKKEAAATSNEFADLASSRKVPDYTAANNTPLTRTFGPWILPLDSDHRIDYHSFFFNLLSWKNPRATAITFVSTLVFIFACRYLPIVRLTLKGTWTILGGKFLAIIYSHQCLTSLVVTLAEAAAKFTIGSSVAGSVRPRRYYKIPKETLEATLDDVEQLINFFVIEIQRIVFAENIPNTAIVSLSCSISCPN